MARGAMVSMWSSDAPVAARPQLARMASVERVSSSSCSSGSRSSLTDRCSAEREQRERLLKADFAWESAAAERARLAAEEEKAEAVDYEDYEEFDPDQAGNIQSVHPDGSIVVRLRKDNALLELLALGAGRGAGDSPPYLHTHTCEYKSSDTAHLDLSPSEPWCWLQREPSFQCDAMVKRRKQSKYAAALCELIPPATLRFGCGGTNMYFDLSSIQKFERSGGRMRFRARFCNAVTGSPLESSDFLPVWCKADVQAAAKLEAAIWAARAGAGAEPRPEAGAATEPKPKPSKQQQWRPLTQADVQRWYK